MRNPGKITAGDAGNVKCGIGQGTVPVDRKPKGVSAFT